ncbi:MAG: hypothetical protein CMN78_01170 [Spirochaetales bacterium]|nr:hypothetical protein [Spirochaetales bacterium]
MSRRLIAILLILVAVINTTLAAQADSENSAEGEEEYLPYSHDEFPEWLHQVRRAEIVLIGSFPITMVFTTLSYEGFRLLKSLFQQDGAAGTMAIEFGDFNTNEKIWLLVCGAVLSVAASVVDLILDRLEPESRE